jgi:hypothetical protein
MMAQAVCDQAGVADPVVPAAAQGARSGRVALAFRLLLRQQVCAIGDGGRRGQRARRQPDRL